jgi:hypothetical protein
MESFGKMTCFVIWFMALSIMAISQPTWEEQTLDLNFSFSMPSLYSEKDTLGEKSLWSTGEFGSMLASKIHQPQFQMATNEDLINYYKSFSKICAEQRDGEVISDSIGMFKNLPAYFFLIEDTWNDSLEVQDNVIVMIKNDMYLFNYVCFKNMQLMASEEKAHFFSSINYAFSIPPISDTERSGMFFGKIAQYILLVTLIAVIVLWYFKKFAIILRIKKVISLLFFSWGAFCVFMYLANKLADNGEYPSLIAVGLICLVIGYVLRVVKIPS